ncbi:MAG: DEAD/DEAH box helicase [bacterium]|nr:DEAD/DEAH box helicase [bacterium]
MYNNVMPRPHRGLRNRGKTSSLSSSPFYSSNANRGRNNSRRQSGEKIDISRFIQKASDQTNAVAEEIVNSFADFGFVSELERNLKVKNYSIPTPIQDQSINHILEGRDIIALANTGTGKTGAFLLPMINKAFKDNDQKVLIITPTRELALQIADEFHCFSFGMRIFSALCIGGTPIGKQIANLRRNPQFVIGTPGRLQDLHKRNLINYNQFQNIVLDEVDRMLDMGFISEIRDILSQFPKVRQSLFFSATMPPKIRALAEEFLQYPITVSINAGKTAQNVEQDIIRVGEGEKFDKLQNILSQPDFQKVLIFSETKHGVEKLKTNLVNSGFSAESIHGDKRQGQRQRALNQFKNNEVTILVATDVAARGLDIKDISHVINYTIPETYDDYIHRIGRTGRANKTGIALTFV